jgi:hypothetical protein
MKQKNLYYLAATFFVLLILYFVTKPRFSTTNIDEIIQSIVIGVSLEDVSNIEVYKETADKRIEMRFAMNEDTWRIPTHFNAKARKSDAEKIIKDVLEMQGKVRAEGENYFNQFEINDNQGLHILLKDETDKVLTNIIVGKKGEDYGTSFVRFAGKDKIFFADKNLLNSIKVYGDADTLSVFKQSSFVDLNAVNYEADELETIAVIKENQELIVKKIEKEVEAEASEADTSKADTTSTEPQLTKVREWIIEKGDQQIELDQKEAEKFVNDLRKINASKVVDRIGQSFGDMNKSAQYGFNRPVGGIIYLKNGNERVQCVFGKEYEEDKGYYFLSGEDKLVYQVSKSNFDKYFKWIEELPKKAK